MTNRQILQKAIEKAVENGFSCGSSGCKEENYHYGNSSCAEFYLEDYDAPDPYTLIFSHDFAKAFWGEEPACIYCDENRMVELDDSDELFTCDNCGRRGPPFFVWAKHLQLMVLEEEPLQYLAKFLEEE